MEVTRLEVAVTGTGIAKTAAELAALDAQSKMAGDSSTSMGRAVSGTGAALDALTAQSQKTRASVRGLDTQYSGLSTRLRMSSAAMDDLTAKLTRQHAIALKPINIPIRVNNGPLAGSGDVIAAQITSELDRSFHKVERDVNSHAQVLDKSISGRLSRIGRLGGEHLFGKDSFTGHPSLIARGISGGLGIGVGAAQLAAISLPMVISLGVALFDVAAGFTAIGVAAAPAVLAIGQGVMTVSQANSALQNAIPGTAAYAKAAANIGTTWAAIGPSMQPAVQAILDMGKNSPMLGQVSRWVSAIAINFAHWFSNRGQSQGLMDLLLAMEGVINRIFAAIERPGAGGLNNFFEGLSKRVPMYAHLLDEALKNIVSIFHAIAAASGEGAGLRVLVSLLGLVAQVLHTSLFQGAITGLVMFDKYFNNFVSHVINGITHLLSFLHANTLTKWIAGLTGALFGLSVTAGIVRKALVALSAMPGLGGIKSWKFVTGGVARAAEGAGGQVVGQVAADALRKSFTKEAAAVVDKASGDAIGKAMADALSMGGGLGIAEALKGLVGKARGALPRYPGGLGALLRTIAPYLAAVPGLGFLGFEGYKAATTHLPRPSEAFIRSIAGQRARQESMVKMPGYGNVPQFDPRIFEMKYQQSLDAERKAVQRANTALVSHAQVLRGNVVDTNKMSMADRTFTVAMERTASVVSQYTTTLQKVTPPTMTWAQVNRNMMQNTAEGNRIAAASYDLMRRKMLTRSELSRLQQEAPNLLLSLDNAIRTGKGIPQAFTTFRERIAREFILTGHDANGNAAKIYQNIIDGLRSKDPIMRKAAEQFASVWHINWRPIVENANRGVGRLADETAKRLTQMDISTKEKMRILHADFHNGYKNIADISAPAWKRIDDISVRGWDAIIKDVHKGSTTAVNTMLTNLGKTPAQSLKVWEQVARDVNSGLIPANNNMKSMINRIVGAAKSGLLPLPGAGKAAIDKFNTYLRAIGAKGAIGTFKGDWAAFIAWLRAHPATPLIKQPVLPVIPGVSPMFVNQAYRTRQHSQFGGTVFAHMPTWVGEAGREIFVPGQTGTIIPHDKAMAMTSGGETNYNMNFSAMNVRTSDVLNAVRILEMRGGGRTV